MKELIDQWWALREPKDNKIRYDLIPLDQVERLAIHYTKWAVAHWDRNWEGGNQAYADKCKESAWRHFMARQRGEVDEDHAMALVWNIFAYEHLTKKNFDKDVERLFNRF